MCRVGQNCIYTLYMTVCMVISLLKKKRMYTVCTYKYMVLAHPTHVQAELLMKVQEQGSS
jgi:hypothetical protein